MKVQRLLLIVTMSVALFSCGNSNNNNNGDWVTRSEFGGPNRYFPTSFAIGTTGYVGTGYDGLHYLKDFWAFNQLLNNWTQVDTLPTDNGRAYSVGFATASYGYAGMGYDGINYYNDFYKYDPVANVWTAITSVPIPGGYGTGRRSSIAFALGTSGYVLGGYDGEYVYKDLYVWDENAGAWTYTSYPGPKRQEGVAFTHNGKAYVVTGIGDAGTTLEDFWVFDPNGNPQWSTLRPIAGVTDQSYDAGYRIVRYNGVAFTMNNNSIPKAYVALGQNGGNLSDCWEYDFATDLWTLKQAFEGQARYGAVGLSINDSGYIGLGTSSGVALSDWTQFYPNLPYNPDDYSNSQ